MMVAVETKLLKNDSENEMSQQLETVKELPSSGLL